MQLESPPLLELLFLESPWAVMVVCLVAGAILFSSGRRRRKKGLLFGSGVAFGMAVGVYALAGAVTTDREQLINDTRDLVAATAPLDMAVLNRLIDPNVVVTGPNGEIWLDAGQVIPRVENVLDRVTIDSQSVRRVNALARDDVRGESVVTIQTKAGDTGIGPINTGWLLTWHREPADGGVWRVVDIRWMRYNGFETPQGVMP